MRSEEFDKEKSMNAENEKRIKWYEKKRRNEVILQNPIKYFYQATFFFLEGSKLPNMAPRYNSRITSPLSTVASTIAVA